VGEGDPHSNVGRLRASFAATPARVVALAEGMLKNGTVPPRFALAWLGMGGDGHVASLFPNTDPRTDDPRPLRRITPDPLPPEAPYPRLTLTLPVFLAADRLVFVIRGAAKRALFEAAMAGEIDLPVARLLRAAKGPVTCFC